jgi:hypothetical protein
MRRPFVGGHAAVQVQHLKLTIIKRLTSTEFKGRQGVRLSSLSGLRRLGHLPILNRRQILEKGHPCDRTSRGAMTMFPMKVSLKPLAP